MIIRSGFPVIGNGARLENPAALVWPVNGLLRTRARLGMNRVSVA